MSLQSYLVFLVLITYKAITVECMAMRWFGIIFVECMDFKNILV